MDKVRKQHYKRGNNINNTVQKALSKLNIAINPFFSRDEKKKKNVTLIKFTLELSLIQYTVKVHDFV